jgi:hypothetical protein
MTEHAPTHSPHASREARYVFAYLHRRGGSLRLRPLLAGLGMDQDAFIDALNELTERCWIAVIWRRQAAVTPDDEFRPLTDIARLCTTRFGRCKYRSTWPTG